MDLTTKATVRRATPSDFTAVIHGIGDMFNGRDELPDKFYDFLEDDDVTAFVVEFDGQGVVGFYLAQYIDDGRTLVKRAGRIHPNYRGLGLFQHLGEFLEKDAKEKGTVEREVVIALKPNAPRLQKLDYQMTHSLEIYDQDVCPVDIPSILVSEYSNVHTMNTSDMELFFSNEEVWNKIVPTGFLWVESLKLRRYKGNIRRLINKRNNCYMSFDDGDQNPQNVLGKYGDEEGKRLTKPTVNKLSMISVCHWFRSQSGMACNLDFFSNNFNDLLPHIKCHLADMKNSEESKICLQVSVNPHRQEFVQEKVEEMFRGFGVRLERDPIMTTDFIFEKSF